MPKQTAESDIATSGHTNRWLVCTLAAHEASRASETKTEARLWRKSADYVSEFSDGDPRRAAGYSNAAFGTWMTGDMKGAVGLIEVASEHWLRSEDWIATLDIPLAASGTAFHLVLASRHGETFTRLRRKKLVDLCRGAAAITKSFAQYLMRAPTWSAQVDCNSDNNVTAIECAFGRNCAEVEVFKRITTAVGGMDPALELRFLGDRWSDEARRTPPDIRPLVDAAYLTAGLHRLPPMPLSQNSNIHSSCNEIVE